jgi:hypothetical protein
MTCDVVEIGDLVRNKEMLDRMATLKVRTHLKLRKLSVEADYC